ncbi:3'-5' exonuclease [Pedobacter arcticus]|uniref:3'-5' exonuclease n=1 Tax=Pedobacter arcticus TaxID=752140 RepID=UPI00031146B1|nr:3'-5' exonuclease [Pedobacter arcticus]
MTAYFLVIDTETSDLPKKWDAPYSTKNNWPHILQIAWIVYNQHGEEVKRENHYLKPGDFKITKASIRIHSLTADFLQENGEERLAVFEKLQTDLSAYKPLIIAHFAELDFCMIGAEYYRLNLPHPLKDSSLFCTLKASATYVKNPTFKFLKLNVFYKTLFKKRPENLHNALVDAELTAEIFFYLLKNGEATTQIIEQHSKAIKQAKPEVDYLKDIQFILLIVILISAIAIYYYGK